MKKHLYVFLLAISLTNVTHAWVWQDLWITPDRKAHALFKTGRIAEAAKYFERSDWHAVAAYRLGDYNTAAQLFQSLNTSEGFFNQGNALAQMGQYAKALHAYTQVLQRNPEHADAAHNQALMERLLQRQQAQQRSSEQKSANKQETKGKNKPANDKAQSMDNKSHKPQSTQEAQSQQETQPLPSNKDPTPWSLQPKQTKPSQPQSVTPKEQERRQLKQQWLRLIPDDPGGFLREKFRRDYLRQQQEWSL